MKEFLVNYFSSVLAGLTLGGIGFTVYKKYYLTQNIKPKQKNSMGDNISQIQNIQTQNNTYVKNFPGEKVDENTETSSITLAQYKKISNDQK